MIRKALVGFFIAFTIYAVRRLWPVSCLCTRPGRLDGKVVLITDGSSFLGSEIAADFARRGATVIVGCQSVDHFNAVVNNVLEGYSALGKRRNDDIPIESIRKFFKPVRKEQVHLNAIESIRIFANEVMKITDRLDFLVNNAVKNHGAYSLTVDRFESTMGIGHLAHYLLTELLSPLLLKTKPGARVIIIASAEHYLGSFTNGNFFVDRGIFNSVRGFSQTKLANVIHGVILAEKFKETSVLPVSLHPGYVLPQFGFLVPTLFGAFFKTRWEASQTITEAALAPDLQPGGYYSECTLTEPHIDAKNKTVVDFIRDESNRLLQLQRNH